MIIDDKLKPWLLEVNVLPSLGSSSVFDKQIKTTLLCDLLTLVGIRGYDKMKVHESGNFPNEDEHMSYTSADYIPDTFQGNEDLTLDEVNILA